MLIHRVLLLAPLFWACSPGTSSTAPGGPGAGSTFEVLDICPGDGATLALNGEVTITFSKDVDLSTVNGNTILIRGLRATDTFGGVLEGPHAVGTYELGASNVVVFRPACPTGAGDAGAGFEAGMHYMVKVRGSDANAPTVQSTAGDALAVTARGGFQVRQADHPSGLYDDPVAGPPAVVVRPLSSGLDAASYLEIAKDDTKRVYWSEVGGNVDLPLGFLAPINTRSRIGDAVSWIVWFDQSVNPSEANLARVRFEWFHSGSFTWESMGARVKLESNCGPNGAVLRVTPLGILPQGTQTRVVVDAGFEDLSGEATTADDDSLVAPTATSYDPGTITPGDDGDQIFAGFETGGLLDTEAIHPFQSATIVNGKLTAGGGFAGTGGPNGDFDWYIPPFTTIIINTVADTIIGGPGGAPTGTQTVINGVIDIRDLFVPAGSKVLANGPNPLTILCTGQARIHGVVSVNGGNFPGVSTLNTTNQPEPGASGQGGGGQGGTGSYLTTQSTPRGGPGFGPFNSFAGGGEGGETSYAQTGKTARRGAGGGGGGHGPDVWYRYDLGATVPVRCQTLVGMDAEPGAPGGELGLGAESQALRAQGGRVGPSPFLDGETGNDFAGRMLLIGGEVIVGELASAAPGSGGGAGGDAVNSASFPLVPFKPTGDEKGAGGGGGAGRIQVLAIGKIVVGPEGQVSAKGGTGGGGENTGFFDRVGGGSGGGSGGSIVLESLTLVEVQGVHGDAGDGYRDSSMSFQHPLRQLDARGGQGGAGSQNQGGANENGATVWKCDSIPTFYDEGQANVPPFNPPANFPCFHAQPDKNDPSGFWTVGAGGDGAPGVVQLHAPNLSDLSFPDAAGDPTKVCTPAPVGYDVFNEAWIGHLVPSYGDRSRAQTRWIPLGLARWDPAAFLDQVAFGFDALGPGGQVLTNGAGEVQLGAPLVGPDTIQSAPQTPHITSDPYTIVFDASVFADDLVKRNPMLLRGSSVRLSLTANPNVSADFPIAEASYDAALDRMRVTVTADNGPLTNFGQTTSTDAALIERSFRAIGSAADQLGPDTSITFNFDATVVDPATGLPDESASLGWTGVAGDLNLNHWDFVRVRVDFDLDADDSGLDPGGVFPALEHLRFPFRF